MTGDYDDDELQEFYYGICGVIEEHADGDVEQAVELIRSLDKFQEVWLDTYGVTGLLWDMED
jgi:hypothetical protein